MRRPIPSLDYVTKDYEGFRGLMLDKIPQIAPEWTDTSQSDMGVVLVELMAYGLDILSYYQDKAINENFLATARTRRGVLNLCRMLGYDVAPQVPAIYEVTFRKSSEYLDEEITVPRGTIVGTDPNLGEQVIFETDDDLIIPVGVLEGKVTVTHGESINKDIVGVGNGEPNQKFKLTYSDAIENTIFVTSNTVIGSGLEPVDTFHWNIVEDFLLSDSESRDYMLQVDEFYDSFLEFGNGVSGMVIPKGQLVIAQYRTGGGSIGNVGMKTINSFVSTEIAGITEISNETKAIQEGKDSEDINMAKIRAPKYFRTQDRAITKQDFEDIVSLFPGVARASIVETFNTTHDILIYVAPDGFGLMTEGFKAKLMEHLNNVKLIHQNPILTDINYIDFDIVVDVLAHTNFKNSDIQLAVTNHLTEAFGLENLIIGEELYASGVYKTVLDAVGVRSVTVQQPTVDIICNETTMPRLRSLTVNVTGGVA